MTQRTLQELVEELERTLRAGGSISAEDRKLLERVHTDLEVALASQPTAAAAPASLRGNLRDAVERLQAEHPRVSSLLSATLDALSDLGV